MWMWWNHGRVLKFEVASSGQTKELTAIAGLLLGGLWAIGKLGHWGCHGGRVEACGPLRCPTLRLRQLQEIPVRLILRGHDVIHNRAFVKKS